MDIIFAILQIHSLVFTFVPFSRVNSVICGLIKQFLYIIHFTLWSQSMMCLSHPVISEIHKIISKNLRLAVESSEQL